MRTPKENRRGRGRGTASRLPEGSSVRTSLAAAAGATRAAAGPPVGQLLLVISCLAASFVWAYWPTIATVVHAWRSHADYSHGFLVLPIGLAMLYASRDRYPAGQWSPALASGIFLVVVSGLIRWSAARFYIDSIDGWSWLVWLAGVVLALGGWAVLKWALPAILFQAFMIPLPYVFETALRLPLQQLATQISTGALVILGYPAVSEVNVIRIAGERYGVEEACSGLRIFVGISALAFAYAAMCQRSWLKRGILLASALPVAIAANCLRIVGTCVLSEMVSSEAAHRFSHDLAGVVMLPVAAVIFFLTLFYLDRLLKETPVIDSTAAFVEHVKRIRSKQVSPRPD